MSYFQKFMGLIGFHHKSYDNRENQEVESQIDFYIKSKNDELLMEALKAGYELNSVRAQKVIGFIFESISKTNEAQKNVLEHILLHNRADFDLVVNAQIKNYNEYLKNVILLSSHVVEHFNCEQLKAVMMQVAGQPLFSKVEPRVKALYIQKFGSEHQSVMSKIKKGAHSTATIPEHIKPYVKRLEELIQQVDVNSLSAGARAEFQMLTDKTLPTILEQYAAIVRIDKKFLNYKNDEHQTVEATMLQSLSTIEGNVQQYISDIEQSRIKDFNITAKHLRAQKL